MSEGSSKRNQDAETDFRNPNEGQRYFFKSSSKSGTEQHCQGINQTWNIKRILQVIYSAFPLVTKRQRISVCYDDVACWVSIAEETGKTKMAQKPKSLPLAKLQPLRIKKGTFELVVGTIQWKFPSLWVKRWITTKVGVPVAVGVRGAALRRLGKE